MGFIKGLLKLVVGLVLLVAVSVFVVMTAARFADGPWAIVAGGSFTTGTPVTEEPDWSFVKDIQEVEFELVATEQSRTTWIAEHEGRVFIPSGYMNTPVGKIWKHWPYKALEDDRIILRIDGKLYQRRLERVMEDPALPYVLGELARKYFPGGATADPGDLPLGEIDSGNLWIFEVLPR